jgi:hypothetical protein
VANLKMAGRLSIFDLEKSETSFPNIFNQNFMEMDRPFKISKILQIVLILMNMAIANLNKRENMLKILLQHQSTYLKGPESASIEIPHC